MQAVSNLPISAWLPAAAVDSRGRFETACPPMPRTMILTPVENSCFDEEIQKKVKQNAEKIRGFRQHEVWRRHHI